MQQKLKISDLLPILEHINNFHEGDLFSLSEWLSQAVYMFHYLPSDTFSEFERQNASHVLMSLKEAVMEIHLNCKNGI